MEFPLRFDFVPYPFWRRRFPQSIQPFAHAFTRLISAGRSQLDRAESIDPVQLAHYLTQWNLMPDGMDAAGARRALESSSVTVLPALNTSVSQAATQPIRIPAQWEPIEAVIVAFPVLYPPLWKSHAAMIAAASAVSRVDILIPKPEWGSALCVALQDHPIQWSNVRFLQLPTNDIWVRDYGAIVGIAPDGSRVAVDAIFDPLDTYPQHDDDHMPPRWAAVSDIPCRPFDMHIEGGNIWSDGAGTLLMSEEILERHTPMTRAEIEAQLRTQFSFDKLILTPYLWREETRHIDLVCKLADARTVLVGAPTPFKNKSRLRATAELFRHETSAAGDPYRVIELPMPAPYLNWGVYPVWRTYTNALIVNGRVLVPVFGISQDQEALAIYQAAMPDYEIIPINCAAAANGGGAVHCLTKEVPRGT